MLLLLQYFLLYLFGASQLFYPNCSLSFNRSALISGNKVVLFFRSREPFFLEKSLSTFPVAAVAIAVEVAGCGCCCCSVRLVVVVVVVVVVAAVVLILVLVLLVVVVVFVFAVVVVVVVCLPFV